MAREGIILRCSNCKQENYITKRNKKTNLNKISESKFCRFCKAHHLHSEKK